MRKFKRYLPGLIAKHVMRLFKGSIYIYGVGRFEFDEGKLILPQQAKQLDFKTVKEVNEEVKRLKFAYA